MVRQDARGRAAAHLAEADLPIPPKRPPGPTVALEARDSVRSALRRLAAEDRHLLLMYYAGGMNLREIGGVLRMSEPAASLRHKALLARLRQRTGARPTRRDGELPW